ncbi:hypothetical protein F5Y12DRAFT_715997 [Xylaria sp. FL1777]|nr:hypothetical protein F5Y12DRAFT_715997 [Xylaria sp. FL1777]
MGRARKKSRRSRSNFRNSNNNGPRNDLDDDDDFHMHGTERNNRASSNQRRGRGGYHNTNGSNRNSNGRGRDGRTSNNGSLPDPFLNNPFENFDLDGSTYQEQEGSRSRQHRRNCERNRDQQGDDNHPSGGQTGSNHNSNNIRRGRGGAYIGPIVDHETHNNNNNNNNNNIRRGRGGAYIGPVVDHETLNYIRAQNARSPRHRSSSPSRGAGRERERQRQQGRGRRQRFCTECSTVRRANLTLRDWMAAGIARASEVLDSWSDEVGVGWGCGDEMDWQPEPVVRVLLVASDPSSSSSSSLSPLSSSSSPWPSTPPTCDSCGAGWQQGSYYGELGRGVGEVAVNYMMGPSPWGLRPGTLGPEFSGGGGVWGNNGGGGGKFAPGSTSCLGQGCVGQMMNNGTSSWTHNAAFGSQYTGMTTPPDTPPSLIT